MKTRTALTALAFIALAVAAPGYAEAPDPIDHATERAAQETRRAIRAMDRVDEDAIAWGQERKANRTTVIVLERGYGRLTVARIDGKEIETRSFDRVAEDADGETG